MDGLKGNIDKLKGLLRRYQDKNPSESNTEAWFIRPFFRSLGYDTSNPERVITQYQADPHDIKTGKVDYALLQNGKPVIFVEGKKLHEPLDSHVRQIRRYFNNTLEVDFAVLTNGNEYRFYTDLVDKNMLDKVPFLEFRLSEIDENLVKQLDQFSSQNYDSVKLKEFAHKISRRDKIYSFLGKEFSSPSDSFVNFVSREVFKTTKKAVRDDVRKDLAGYLSSQGSTSTLPTDVSKLKPKQPDLNKDGGSSREEQNIFEIENVKGTKLDYFRFQNETISDINWTKMFVYVLCHLCHKDSQKLVVASEGIKALKITPEKKSIRDPKSIGNDLFVGTNLNTQTKVLILKKMLSSFDMKEALHLQLR